jgi:hypothetical protein
MNPEKPGFHTLKTLDRAGRFAPTAYAGKLASAPLFSAGVG